MARITIEDCMEHVDNRFHLVRMASIRAKQLKKGALPLLSSEGNKQAVMSLREIAAGLVKPGDSSVSAPVEAAVVAAPVTPVAPAAPVDTTAADATVTTPTTPSPSPSPTTATATTAETSEADASSDSK